MKIINRLFALILIGIVSLNVSGEVKAEQSLYSFDVLNSSSEEDSKITYINNFIAKYNASAVTQIQETESFDPKDKSSGHYRTEFRLSAWDDSVGFSANIGDSLIDIVSCKDFFNATEVRIYVTSNTLDSLFDIFNVAARALDNTVTEEEIQNVIEHVVEMGDYNGFSIGDMESGLISQNYSSKSYELMLAQKYKP